MSEKSLNESSQPLTSRVVKETCYDGDSEDSMCLESNTSFPSNDNDSVEVLSNTLAKYLLNYEKTDMKRDDIGESVKFQPKSPKDVVTYKDLIEFLFGQPFDEPEPDMNNEISKTESYIQYYSSRNGTKISVGAISRATQTETIIRCIYCDTICCGEVCPAEGKQCDLCGDIGHIRAACLRNF